MIFTLTKHPLCNLGQCCHYIETKPLIYGTNQWDDFYTIATLDWNKLILTTIFSIYYFFLSWRNLFQQFYVLLSTNQIKLYIYPDLLKKNPLLRKFLKWESTAYFSDETFYHKHIPLFSMTISAAIVIKAKKYSMYYIIYHSYDVATEYSIISTVKYKVILSGW